METPQECPAESADVWMATAAPASQRWPTWVTLRGGLLFVGALLALSVLGDGRITQTYIEDWQDCASAAEVFVVTSLRLRNLLCRLRLEGDMRAEHQ